MTRVLLICRGGEKDPGVQLHLKELELEMRHLAIKEKELDCELQSRKLEFERQLFLKELELRDSSPLPIVSWSDKFDIDKCVCLVTPFW